MRLCFLPTALWFVSAQALHNKDVDLADRFFYILRSTPADVTEG